MSLTTITTVTDEASSYDLTTLAVVKAELGITDNTTNAVLTRYISGASAAAAQFCNRVFPLESVQDVFLADERSYLFTRGGAVLQLTRWPVTTVTSLVENGVTLVENTDFLVSTANGQLTRIDANGLKRHWSQLPITVIYEAGFETIPADLEDAVVRMVASRYLAKGRDRSIRQENIPGLREVSYWISTGTDAGNLSPDVADILQNYRVPVLV